jgi:hypothetical protein
VEPGTLSFSDETLIHAAQSVIGKILQGRGRGPIAGTVLELASAQRETKSTQIMVKIRRS